MTLRTYAAGPFDVSTEDLVRIGPEEAVDLFRQLLIIEAGMVGLPVTAVDVPEAINVSDGGIDAEVAGVGAAVPPAGLIAPGVCRYQIKTGGFSANKRSDVKKLLVQPKYQSGVASFSKEHLQPRVLSCFEKGGTFFVVLFGTDLVGTADDYGVTEIKRFMALIDPAFSDVQVRVIRANQICSAIRTLAPGIAMRLNGIQGYDTHLLHDISFMANSCELEVELYRATDYLDDACRQLTNAADTLDGFRHVRVLGDAGAGKTHLIYRALAASRLSGCVLYCPDPEKVLSSAQVMALRHLSMNAAIVLVADECDLEVAEGIVALFKRVAVRMLLVTANNEAEEAVGHANLQLIEMPTLQQSVIAEIFEAYEVPHEEAEWLASLCEGSPRAAHRLGQYIRSNPEQHPTQHISHLDVLWNRFVCSPYDVDSADGQDRLAVLRTIALFKQVAWGDPHAGSAQVAVLEGLRRLDPSFAATKLARVVEALRKKRILQGPRVLRITPKLLHVAMWKGWFESYSAMLDVTNFRNELDARMKSHFDAMLLFVRESRAAAAWADRLLGSDGVFASLDFYCDADNASLFFAIAQVDPKAALRRFASALGKESVEARKRLSGDARRLAVRRLEQFAVPAETFFEAVQCLLLLAEAENESWSNNATGVFVSMFGLGYGRLAASEVSPFEKLGFLRRQLRSDVSFYREIVIKALSESLNPFLSRNSIEETIGLTRLPGRWMPETYGELHAAYGEHVKLLADGVEYLPEVDALAAARGIVGNFRSLVRIMPVSRQVLDFLDRAGEIDKLREACIESLVAAERYEGDSVDGEILARMKDILSRLVNSSFQKRLRRHAGMKLVEDYFNAEGDFSDGPNSDLIALVAEAVVQPELLLSELHWLVTEEAKNGFIFGKLLGHADDLRFWSEIVSAWSRSGEGRSDFFVGGYLSSVYERDVGKWECLVNTLIADTENRSYVLELVWRSGMSESVARSLLAMAVAREIEPSRFRVLVYGSVILQLPMDVLIGVVGLLLQDGGRVALDAAVDILDSRLRGAPEEVGELAEKAFLVLGSPVFISGGDAGRDRASSRHGNMTVYHWNGLANRLLTFDADRGAQIAVRCIENFGCGVTSGYRPESLDFLCKAAHARPAPVWEAVAQRLIGQRGDAGTWSMSQWLRGGRRDGDEGDGGLEAIPFDLIREWIDNDANHRAPLIADCCSPTISKPGEPQSVARKLIEQYAGIDAVRDSLHSGSFSGVWWGPASQHFRGKLEALEEHLSVESDINVKTWLLEHRELLLSTIQKELERESTQADDEE